MMIGPTHEKRIENWLTSFGVDQSSLPIDQLKEQFQDSFNKFSRKSGAWVRFEINFKRSLKYQSFPAPFKKFFQSIKRFLRLNRERSTEH